MSLHFLFSLKPSQIYFLVLFQIHDLLFYNCCYIYISVLDKFFFPTKTQHYEGNVYKVIHVTDHGLKFQTFCLLA